MTARSRGTTSSLDGARLTSVCTGLALAALAAPLLTEADDSRTTALVIEFGALVVAAVVARATSILVVRRGLAPLGVVFVAAAAVLLAATPRGVITVVIAAVLGAGGGIALPARE